MKFFAFPALLAAAVLPVSAHDTWLQTNVSRALPGQPVFVDLMLGNHGNSHRDFKLASKIPLANSSLRHIAPDGTAKDLIPSLIDTGLAEKEGYWSAKLPSPIPGLHLLAHTYDAVVSYAPKRAIKSAKVFVTIGANSGTSFSTPIGQPLEIVPLQDPTSLKAGAALSVRVLFKGQPLPDAVVSCIPRGVKLAEEFDERFERRTSSKGEATLPISQANYHLVVTRVKAPEETGETYSDGTEYSAALTFISSES